jgi:hypothetical protein
MLWPLKSKIFYTFSKLRVIGKCGGKDIEKAQKTNLK